MGIVAVGVALAGAAVLAVYEPLGPLPVTRVVVNDASCLIDPQKGRLLQMLCRLPYRFVVPLPIRNPKCWI